MTLRSLSHTAAFTALALVFSATAYAGIFNSQSVLPPALQARIETRVASACPTLVNVSELETRAEFVPVETFSGVDIRDTKYTTRLKASYWFQNHPISVTLYVTSMVYDYVLDTKERFEVLSLESDDASICH